MLSKAKRWACRHVLKLGLVFEALGVGCVAANVSELIALPVMLIGGTLMILAAANGQ
ncbi:hypothetical protein H3C70_01945 [Patescibacteria group bacterium]|nr:hypothetical protein [Patescibacteria group bacterium]